jgi:hypothetical protein
VVVLALMFVPVFFVVVLKSAEWIRTRGWRKPAPIDEPAEAVIVPEQQA